MIAETKGKTTILSFRVPIDIKQLVDEAAKEENLTRSQWLEKNALWKLRPKKTREKEKNGK